MKGFTLVLGSGGARGLSFIGALRVLSENGVPISRVIGTSMGALVGASFCSGVSIADLEAMACKIRLKDFVRLRLSGPALLSPEPVERLVRRFVSCDTFEELKTPLSAVATDIETGESLVYSSGVLVPPVTGSCLAAGLFGPVVHGGRHLVDGGYTNPVPVSCAPPGSPIIVVDSMVRPDWRIPFPEQRSLRNCFAVRLLLLQFLKGIDCSLYRLSCATATDRRHVRIVPQLGEMRFTEFSRARFAIDAGVKATMEKMEEIEAQAAS